MKKPNQLRSCSTLYTIGKSCGSGGNAVVFEATDESGNQFAAKVLTEEASESSEKLKRFKNELEFCQRSIHDHVIKVVDHGHAETINASFYVMELYDGTFRTAIKENWLTEEQALDVFLKSLAGLIFAHKSGVIHRDLKPENILIDKNLQKSSYCRFRRC